LKKIDRRIALAKSELASLESRDASHDELKKLVRDAGTSEGARKAAETRKSGAGATGRTGKYNHTPPRRSYSKNNPNPNIPVAPK
jgi:hypothetical protein